jgi:hypothetical protein
MPLELEKSNYSTQPFSLMRKGSHFEWTYPVQGTEVICARPFSVGLVSFLAISLASGSVQRFGDRFRSVSPKSDRKRSRSDRKLSLHFRPESEAKEFA